MSKKCIKGATWLMQVGYHMATCEPHPHGQIFSTNAVRGVHIRVPIGRHGCSGAHAGTAQSKRTAGANAAPGHMPFHVPQRHKQQLEAEPLPVCPPPGRSPRPRPSPDQSPQSRPQPRGARAAPCPSRLTHRPPVGSGGPWSASTTAASGAPSSGPILRPRVAGASLALLPASAATKACEVLRLCGLCLCLRIVCARCDLSCLLRFRHHIIIAELRGLFLVWREVGFVAIACSPGDVL